MTSRPVDPRTDLAGLIALASRCFFTPESLDETMSKVTAAATDMIGGADCADILLIAGRNTFQSHAATSELPIRLDSVQELADDGPCVDAARHDTVVLCNNLAADTRWTAFREAAAAAGVRSSLSLPLFAGGSMIGALNLFGFAVGAFTPADIDVGQHLATHAAIAIFTASRSEQFSSPLATRDLIGQAKGMLMERYDIDALQAFDLLSRLSQDSNTPVATLAANLVVLGSETRAR